MGFFSGIKKIGKAIVSGIDSVINTAGEIIGRVIGLPGFLFDLIVPWPRKKLRMRILILQNEDGSPLDATRNLVLEARAAYDLARAILKREANVKLISYGNLARVEVLNDNPPTAALEPRCRGPFIDSFGEAGFFFLANKQYSISILLLGNGAPISSFIVREIENDEKVGCSSGGFSDYLFVSSRGLTIPSDDDVGPASHASTTLAHEIGHSCGLNYMGFSEHSKKKNNLMYKDNTRGTRLNRLQKAGLRNSRFVTYL
ncbi:MAG: hypothetical protein COA50_11685 [Flavobacteriaceae bacterium]|nr:MAG: hypothetical protein COA50_11685 [Flavobacteriaceae bacterium]